MRKRNRNQRRTCRFACQSVGYQQGFGFEAVDLPHPLSLLSSISTFLDSALWLLRSFALLRAHFPCSNTIKTLGGVRFASPISTFQLIISSTSQTLISSNPHTRPPPPSLTNRPPKLTSTPSGLLLNKLASPPYKLAVYMFPQRNTVSDPGKMADL